MADAAAGAHHLHITGHGTALVAQVVLMRDGAFAHIGDDFHVGMRVRRETGLRCNRIVVPDAQRTPVHAVGIMVFGKGKMVLGIQPAVVGGTEAVEAASFNHVSVLGCMFTMTPV